MKCSLASYLLSGTHHCLASPFFACKRPGDAAETLSHVRENGEKLADELKHAPDEHPDRQDENRKDVRAYET